MVNTQGRIQDFHLGGGGTKDYMRERTLRARNPKSLSAGIQGPALGVFNALQCYLSPIFKHSDTKWVNKKITVDPILGGAHACCAPLDPPLILNTVSRAFHGICFQELTFFRHGFASFAQLSNV